MNLTQLIVELGGFGAISSAVLRLFAMGRQTASEKREHNIEDLNGERSWIRETREFLKATSEQTGPMVHRMLAVACFIVLVSPIIVPIAFDYVTVHYYIPKSVSFLTLDINMWKDLQIGPDVKTLPTGKVMRHIAIYPMQISLCANYLSFYLAGRALKHK